MCEKFMKFIYKHRYKLIVSIIAIITTTAILWITINPLEPKKPETIPLGDYSYTIEYVDHKINALMKEHDLPSVVVAMIDEDDVIYKHAYGLSDVEKEIPATLDTVYKIGSITKLFTGIEVMRMYEEGLIDLESPITEYIPGFSIKGNIASEPITIRSLLSHRSGLPRSGTLPTWHWDVRPNILEALTDSLSESYQAFPVGYRYKYSNIGYNVLGRTIEVVRGIEPPAEISAGGWPYYMEDAILAPMEMNNSALGSDMLLYGKESSLDIAKGYYSESGKNKSYNQYEIIKLASGNMQSTMNDMVKFGQYILNIEKGSEDEIINGDTLWSMYEAQNIKPNDPQTNGLAWFTDRELLDELVVFHSGTNQGVISLIMLMPEQKLGFIVFANSDEFEDVQNVLAIDALKLMMETKFGTKFQEPKTQAEANIGISKLESYTGKYVINGDIIEIVLKGDKLKAIYSDKKIEMVPISQSKFRLNSPWADLGNIELEFFIDQSDDEDMMVLTMGDHFVCPRYENVLEVPPSWEEIVGNYKSHARYHSDYSETDVLGSVEIYIEDNVLFMSDGKVLKPISDGEITIVGGVFGGETMIFDKDTGNITWQHLIYRPTEQTIN